MLLFCPTFINDKDDKFLDNIFFFVPKYNLEKFLTSKLCFSNNFIRMKSQNKCLAKGLQSYIEFYGTMKYTFYWLRKILGEHLEGKSLPVNDKPI